jgi:hypothetical protein
LNWAEYVAIASFLSVPVAIAFGVLKYRLYDIDIVINRAVVYGAIAVFITVVYVAVVVGIGAAVGRTGDTALSALAAAVVALAFQPVRRAAQRLGNRVVYGKRATPYEVLADLGARFARGPTRWRTPSPGWPGSRPRRSERRRRASGSSAARNSAERLPGPPRRSRPTSPWEPPWASARAASRSGSGADCSARSLW